jgi:Putative DNA-binding domain
MLIWVPRNASKFIAVVIGSVCSIRFMNFPGLHAVLGEDAFNRVSRAHVLDCPSRSFTLRNLGSCLAEWLACNPRYAGSSHPLATDMARLEWAHIEAFDSFSKKVLGPEDLIEIGPDFHAGLQPHLRMLALRFPVDNLRIQVNERRTRKIRASRLTPAQTFVAVYRLNDSVYYRRLESEEYHLLDAIGQGNAIRKAIRSVFDNRCTSIEQRSMLERWFAVWAELGWLCPRRSERTR